MRFPNSFNFLIFVFQGLTVQKKTSWGPNVSFGKWWNAVNPGYIKRKVNSHLKKNSFFPCAFSPLSFCIQELSCPGRLGDICSPDCLNINLYFKICLYVWKRETSAVESYKCAFYPLDRTAAECAVMLGKARDVIWFDRTSLLWVSEVLTCSRPTLLVGWVGPEFT